MIFMTNGAIGTKKGTSFIIRLWLEAREMAGEAPWRWHVHHVQSGDEANFTRLADVLTYIEEKVGHAPAQ